MQKPQGYDEVTPGGEFESATVGGHYAEIKQVSETITKTNKEMIVVVFDLINPDKQAGIFGRQFQNDDRFDRKWPYSGTMRVLVQDYSDPSKVSKSFKSFCTCTEKSNPGFTVGWGNNWGDQFRGKKIGVVYGEVEDDYNGESRMYVNPRWFCDWDKVADAAVPKPKYKNAGSAATSAPTSAGAGSGAGTTSGINDEDIPF